MMNSLDALVITFLVLTSISFAGLLVMFLGKKDILKKIGFYYTTVAAIGLTTVNVIYHPPLTTVGILVVIGLGLVAVAAFVIHFTRRTPKMRRVARIMTAVSMVAAVVDLAMV